MTMRPFFWRIVLCLTPVVIAALATWHAWANNLFKLGIDLSGGTILVYEIDTRKQQQRDQESGRSPQENTNLLADALKRRIDPTSTYDIKIRPAGAGGRVEIVLPTGGAERARAAQDAWNELLKRMKERWLDKYKDLKDKDLEITRGHVQELIETIQARIAEHVWKTRVFNDPKIWQDLIARAQNRVPAEDKEDRGWTNLQLAYTPAALASLAGLGASPGRPLVTAAGYGANFASLTPAGRLWSVPVGDLKGLVEALSDELTGIAEPKAIESWVKRQAWNNLLRRVQKEWPGISANDLKGIAPDAFEELVGRIEAKGNVITQAALETLRPLLGPDAVDKGLNDRKKIVAFIEENYGPSPKSIGESISETDREIGRTKDLTVEQVQKIKELVARVGSLEFRILANAHDDKEAIKDASAYINSSASKDELERAAVRGEPPPGPRTSAGDLKEYDIDLPRNNKSRVTYSWVELGPQERTQLGLDNASRNEARESRKRIWDYMHNHLGEAIQIPVPDSTENRLYLQGALFFGREVKDRNMPEEQKHRKMWEYFILTRNPEIDPATGKETPKIDGSYLVNAQAQASEGRPAVHFMFNATGGDLFGTLTRKNVPSGSGPEQSQIKRHLAIILDGLIVSAPTVNSEIRQHGQISGSFTRKEVDNLVNILRSGALPATLKPQPVSETTIASTLGEDSIYSGRQAILLAFGAVVVFMMLYYRFAGIVASVALFANLLLTVGFMVLVQATFTLPGLAGLVLMLGMAVDANVLIYERFREERDRGASLALAIRNGYDRAFPTIIDTHLSSIFTAIVLYVVGNDQLKGFGVSLTVGLIISLFTSLFMTRLIFDFWLSRGWLHKLSMARLLSKPDFDFMGIRYYCFTFTVVLTVVGLAVFLARLPADLNIDFQGGTAFGGQLTKKVTMTELREMLSEERQKEMLRVVDARQEDNEGLKWAIVYQEPGGTKTETREVLLANKVDNKATLIERASILPDPSIEQLLPSSDKTAETDQTPGSRYFTVRTTEKETELVQAQLDRLLREKGKDGKWQELMLKEALEYDLAPLEAKGKEVKLTFTQFDDRSKPADASPSFVTMLLKRELEKAFGVKSVQELPFQIELVGVGRGNGDGQFDKMKLAFTPDLKSDQVAKVKTALERTRVAFEDRPAPDRLENFDSELAAQIRLQAMWAILASWAAIALYLWFRFGSWTFGLAAVLCLIHDLFFTLGIIAFCHYLHGTWFGNLLQLEDFKIDLTAVAALLTLVGYSVNDTIVVFDRIREVRGKNPDLTIEMINDSVNQTLSRTLLTSLTAWLVVVVLYFLGGPGVHLFAFVMVVGVIVGTYSSIYVASPLLLMFGEGTRSRSGVLVRRPATAGAPA
jgi:SecD/SecF fusion protein